METGIKIDASNNLKEAAGPLSEAIIAILNANAEQETLRHALTVFQQGVSLTGASICNNVIDARTLTPYEPR
jgi:hypothetical protein